MAGAKLKKSSLESERSPWPLSAGVRALMAPGLYVRTIAWSSAPPMSVSSSSASSSSDIRALNGAAPPARSTRWLSEAWPPAWSISRCSVP